MWRKSTQDVDGAARSEHEGAAEQSAVRTEQPASKSHGTAKPPTEQLASKSHGTAKPPTEQPASKSHGTAKPPTEPPQSHGAAKPPTEQPASEGAAEAKPPTEQPPAASQNPESAGEASAGFTSEEKAMFQRAKRDKAAIECLQLAEREMGNTSEPANLNNLEKLLMETFLKAKGNNHDDDDGDADDDADQKDDGTRNKLGYSVRKKDDSLEKACERGLNKACLDSALGKRFKKMMQDQEAESNQQGTFESLGKKVKSGLFRDWLGTQWDDYTSKRQRIAATSQVDEKRGLWRNIDAIVQLEGDITRTL